MRQIMQHMPMLTLAKMHLQRVCVCTRRFVASRDNNLFQLRKYGSKSKAGVRGLHLRYFSTRRRGLRDCSLIPRPANMTPSLSVSALKRGGGGGGCASALIERQKSSFPWQGSLDEKLKLGKVVRSQSDLGQWRRAAAADSSLANSGD